MLIDQRISVTFLLSVYLVLNIKARVPKYGMWQVKNGSKISGCNFQMKLNFQVDDAGMKTSHTFPA
jgi:hypothetical protein